MANFKTARPIIYGFLHISRATAWQPNNLPSPVRASSLFLFVGKCNQNISHHHRLKLCGRAQRLAKNDDDVFRDGSCPSSVDFAQ